MVRSAHFFCFIPNYGSSGACPQKMSQIGLKLMIWWPKQSSVIEKVKPHRARILFRKSVKTCPKWFALTNFFVLSPTMAQVKHAHKKWSQIRLKLMIWWPKQGSVIEKVKPHRAWIFFRKLVKKCPKWLTVPNFFLFYPQLCFKWSMPTKNEPNRTKIDDLVAKTKFGDRKSSASSSADTFRKSVKTCPKWFALPDFFCFNPRYYGSRGACPQKMVQI